MDEKELFEVAGLLRAAEQMADGLVDLLEYVCKLDGRSEAAAAAARHLAIVVNEERAAADDRSGF